MSKASFTRGESQTYDHALWTGSARWRGLLAIVLLFGSFLIVSSAITFVGMMIDASLGNVPEHGPVAVTPIAILTINASLAAQLPIAVLLQWWLFGVRPRWMSSVEGRLRWGWLGRLALIIVPLYAVYAVVSFTVAPLGPLRIDDATIFLALILLLSVPFQAAGEEYAVRGLVQRSIGSWFRGIRVSLIVSTALSSIVFAFMHATPDPWRVAYYVVFGIAASLATWGTGGLEAAILIHGVNNLLVLVPVALTGGLEGYLERSTTGGGPLMLVPMMVLLLSAGICIWMAWRSGIPTHAVPSLKNEEEGIEP